MKDEKVDKQSAYTQHSIHNKLTIAECFPVSVDKHSSYQVWFRRPFDTIFKLDSTFGVPISGFAKSFNTFQSACFEHLTCLVC